MYSYCLDKKKLLEVAKFNAMQMFGVTRLELPESVKPILSEDPESKRSSPEPMTRLRQGSPKTEVGVSVVDVKLKGFKAWTVFFFLTYFKQLEIIYTVLIKRFWVKHKHFVLYFCFSKNILHRAANQLCIQLAPSTTIYCLAWSLCCWISCFVLSFGPVREQRYSLFIPVFIDDMKVISFTHRHLGLKGWLGYNNICVFEKVVWCWCIWCRPSNA